MLALPQRLPARLKAPSLASTRLCTVDRSTSLSNSEASALPMLTAMLTKSRGLRPAKAATFVPAERAFEAESRDGQVQDACGCCQRAGATRVGEAAEASRIELLCSGADRDGAGEVPGGVRYRAGAYPQREVAEGARGSPRRRQS